MSMQAFIVNTVEHAMQQTWHLSLSLPIARSQFAETLRIAS